MTKVLFGNIWCSVDDILSYSPINDTERRVIEIIQKWQSNSEYFQFKTSGSTGTPKVIELKRSQLLASAQATIKALELRQGQTALLAINPNFIGGTMMVIRALIGQMNLIVTEPSANPLAEAEHPIDFAAFVPLQMHEIQDNPKTRMKLEGINKVIIGGGAIQSTTFNAIKNSKSELYATYGMTETVSHIALQKLNGPNNNEFFHALENVKLSIDARNCLVINGPQTDNQDIVTNDIVELIDNNKFRWLGRIDNVINTGGIKVNSEQLEKKIDQLFHSLALNHTHFIAGLPDEKLGQKIVLFMELENVPHGLEKSLEKSVSKYERPKEIIAMKEFAYTLNDKIDRPKTIQRYLKHI